ncbi:MAG: hypothetical protein NZM04_09555 [Methylacidiphilales bacterium]|nr:hypothetical protein [Candidatus Methylacidiphilales bacterium]
MRRKGTAAFIVPPVFILIMMIFAYMILRIQFTTQYHIRVQETISSAMRWSILNLNSVNACRTGTIAYNRSKQIDMGRFENQEIRYRLLRDERKNIITLNAKGSAPDMLGSGKLNYDISYKYYTDAFQSRDHAKGQGSFTAYCQISN